MHTKKYLNKHENMNALYLHKSFKLFLEDVGEAIDSSFTLW